MKQRTLAMTNGFERYGKKTRRAEFLEEMEQVVSWKKLGALIEPHYPKTGNGRPRWDWNGCCACTFCKGLGRSGVSWAERGDSAMRAARARLHPATLSV